MNTFTFKERLFSYLNLLPVPIYDAFAAPLFGHVLALAIRVNLFETLLHPRSAEEVARAVNISTQASSLFLSSLATTGYTQKVGSKYRVTPSAKKWLLKSSPYYLGNFIRYVELLYSHWLYLGETVKNGEPPATYIESFGEKEWEIYVFGMMDLAKMTLPHIASKMKLPVKARRLLDLGGSHGLYSIELCKRYASLHATIADFPQVLQFTKKIIEDHHLSERISLEACNVLEHQFEENFFDAALAFNIVHGLNAEQNKIFLQNISRTLRPGGCLYILDEFIDRPGSTMEQFMPLMVGINIMNEVGGSVYSLDELREWSAKAGLVTMRFFRLRLPGVMLVRLEKLLPSNA